MSQEDIKIRVVPRSNERPKRARVEQPVVEKQASKWIYVMGTLAAGLWIFLMIPTQTPSVPAAEKRTISSLEPKEEAHTRISASVERHLRESVLREEMIKRRLQIENSHMPTEIASPEVSLEAQRPEPLMAQEKTHEQVFKDLDLNSQSYSDRSPDDRINARLANRKWLNEVERSERINFVRNFIRSAYDRGYEVTLNENLVVVGVRKIKKDRAVTIDQIMDRMAKQGL